MYFFLIMLPGIADKIKLSERFCIILIKLLIKIKYDKF